MKFSYRWEIVVVEHIFEAVFLSVENLFSFFIFMYTKLLLVCVANIWLMIKKISQWNER